MRYKSCSMLQSRSCFNQPTAKKENLKPPKHWLKCPAMGSIVLKHFLPIKTPLCSRYDKHITDVVDKFYPEDVFLQPLESNTKICLWIDLTDTNRYYSMEEVTNHDCTYMKIPLEYKNDPPSAKKTNNFCVVVENYLKHSPKAVIVVQSTYGFNQTGFLISAYLAKCLNWSIYGAITLFAKHRPCGIFKQHFIDELLRRYSFKSTIEFLAPPRTHWFHSKLKDTDLNGSDTSEPVFLNGIIPTVTYVSEPLIQNYVVSKIRHMCGCQKAGFPGSLPILLENNAEYSNMKFLANEFLVTRKVDGSRYLLLIDSEDSIYALDTQNNPFEIPGIRFPNSNKKRHLQDTLVDCEISVGEEVGAIPNLCIFDIIAFDGSIIRGKSFLKRLSYIEDEIIQPREDAFKTGLLKSEPFVINSKEFMCVSRLPTFHDGELYGHNDFILKSVNGPYESGRTKNLLIWRSPFNTTAILKMKLEIASELDGSLRGSCSLYVVDEHDPVADLEYFDGIAGYDGKLIKCKYADSKWKFLCLCKYRSFPSKLNTVNEILITSLCPISKQELVSPLLKHLADRIEMKTKLEEKRMDSLETIKKEDEFDEIPAKRKKTR